MEHKIVIIPVKANSQGAPNKNRLLLKHCVEETLKAGYPICIIGDDKELLHEYSRFVDTHLLPPIGSYVDITDSLRKWRNDVSFVGDIALVQCTSPKIKHEWIGECLSHVSDGIISATACEVAFKPTAMYREIGNGLFVPYCKDAPSASVARQLLPHTIRITGAVEAFQSKQLDFESLYDNAAMIPVMVDERESLDIDTKEQLEEFLKNIR